MKEVHKALAVLVCWSIAAVAYASAECTIGDIRLSGEERSAIATTGAVEVCVSRIWTTVCLTGGWHSDSLDGISNNTRVACRQLGYREEGATFTSTQRNPTTPQGLRQEMCSGSEQKLINCPPRSGSQRCQVGTSLTCATCDTPIRLRGGRTATEGRVEVCRDGQWGTVCDDSWDRNDTSVACRQLGLSDFNPVAVPAEFFGVGSARIHLSNLQCTGSEAALTDCTFDATNQCSHNQDAGVMCGECTNEDIRIAYDSEIQTVEFCDYLFWNMCDNACQDMNGVRQLGAYFCGSGEITHFLMNGSQLYECPISGAGDLLICRPTIQNLSPNCQQALEAIELQANSDSIRILWINDDYAETINNNSTFGITCSPEGSDLRLSIVVEPATSEVTMENLPHYTTYECCVTLHIGRYSTRACNNTATLTGSDSTTPELPSVSVAPRDQTTAPDGASIALGVLVAGLVLLLILATGAMLYLLIMRGKHKEGNASQSSTNRPQEYQLENPQYTTSPTLTPPSSTPHTLTTAAPPHTLTPPFPTEPHQYNNVVDTPMLDLTYDIVQDQPKRMNKSAAKLPTNGALLPAREAGPEEGVQGSEYSVLNRSEADLVYAVVDKKAKKKNRQAAMTEAAYEAPNTTADSQGCDPDEYSHLQH